MNEIVIRDVELQDATAIAAIYAHHVLHGTATYDVHAPAAHEIEGKIAAITDAGWPFVVARVDTELAGYAYVTQFRDRAAYRFACEDSIYVHPDRLGRGIGKAILAELCRRAEAAGFRQILAVIGGAEPGSIAVHRSCGFEIVGRLSGVGWKKERWLDSVYMQRSLGWGSNQPPLE